MIGRFGGRGPIDNSIGQALFLGFVIFVPFCLLFTKGFLGVFSYYLVIGSIVAYFIIKERRKLNTEFNELKGIGDQLIFKRLRVIKSYRRFNDYVITEVREYIPHIIIVYVEVKNGKLLDKKYFLEVSAKNFRGLDKNFESITIKYNDPNTVMDEVESVEIMVSL